MLRAVRSGLLAVSLAVSLSACPRGPAQKGPPPPAGKTMDEYLADDHKAPPRPKGTDERDSMRLHVIDVGQGAAALLEFPCGAILVDAGGEENAEWDGVEALIAYLDQFFERRSDLNQTLALFVVTHPHIDHTRGIPAVLARYRILNVLDNGDVREDTGGLPQLALHDWLAKHRNVGHLDLSRSDIDDRLGLGGQVIDPIGSCKASSIDPVIRALWSGDLGREEVGHDPNNDSVVLRVDFGEAAFLLPGDIELLAIAKMVKKFSDAPELLDADVFVVPHHGSRHSITGDLVRRVSPEIALISAGPYSRHLGTTPEFTAHQFGHPHKIAIDHLLEDAKGLRSRKPTKVWVGKRGAWKDTPSEFEERTIRRAIYATAWDGTITVTGFANGWLEVTTARDETTATSAAKTPAQPAPASTAN